MTINKFGNLLGALVKPKEDAKLSCYSYLRYPQMYAENECDQCKYFSQCDQASKTRWEGVNQNNDK